MKKQRPHPLVIAILAAVLLRAAILAANAVPFNSDEAVVGLMARHTLQGEWPVFFYGQSYMGSLDSTLIAAAFALLGQSVIVIRLVQTALFLGIVASTYALAIRFWGDRTAAGFAALLMALPPVLISTYTTATLGGYGEILLLGNLALWLGHTAAAGRLDDWRIWLGLGAAAGLGFWTSALMVVYLLPVAVLLLVVWIKAIIREKATLSLFIKLVLLALAAFLLFSWPWWQYNLTHGGEAIRFMLTGKETSGIGIEQLPLATRLAGLAFFGLTALIGLRFPWSPGYDMLLAALVPLVIYPPAAIGSAIKLRRQNDKGHFLLWGVVLTFIAVFALSRFGTDATGRYFLPLAVPLALWTGELLSQIHQKNPRLAAAGLVLLLCFNLLGNGLAIHQNPPGLTTQFDPSNRFDNTYDDELIAFLKEINCTRGYSNYFVAFRLAFLSHETIILSPKLPYKPDLSYNPADDRYPPYTSLVENAQQIVYVTSIRPELDTLLAKRLALAGVSAKEKQIGPYHVFYSLSQRAGPDELGLGMP